MPFSRDDIMLMERNIRPVATEDLAEEVRKLVSEGKNVTVTARGNSMNPVFRDRKDRITLSPCDKEKIKLRDVVLVRTMDGRYVIHRIIRKTGETIVLSGDGNVAITETALSTEIIALVTGYTRNGKERSCSSACWKAYSRLWMVLAPARKPLLRIWRKINRNKNNI